MEWTKELIDRFMQTDPATYGHFVGVRFMKPEMKPINKHSKMIGPAYTVRILGKDSCAMYKAIEEAPKGSVLVIDRCCDQVYAAVGEMVARNAKAAGLAGIVLDGPATDSLWIEEMDFPVFCTGISVATTNVWGLSGEYNTDVNCGGAVVHPGDIVFGDADGVVVMDPENYEENLVLAEGAAARERKMREQFKTAENSLAKPVGNLMKHDLVKLINDLRLGELDLPEYHKK